MRLDPSKLRDRCAIAGIGATEFSRGTDVSVLELHLEAAHQAVADAGLRPEDIDAIMPSAMAGRIAEEFIVNLGLHDLAFSATIHTGGASVVSSVQAGCLAIAAGVARHVLVVAGRLGYSEQRVSISTAPALGVQAFIDEFEKPYGNIVGMQWFAQAAQRHMHEYGTRSEHFGRVAVACRRHANLNPRALMHDRSMTLDDHQASPMIVTPFRLFDCSLESDGAAALVLTSTERARDLCQAPITIAGIGEGHGDPPTSVTQKRDIAFMEGAYHAGQRAFAMANMTPDDIDCAQIYDGFTWFVIAQLEALGFCGRGEGGPFVENGRIELGGQLPVNTHGGLLSEAHVSGINHIVEAVRQLRRDVEPERQVLECTTVLITGEGGFHEGSAMILHRP